MILNNLIFNIDKYSVRAGIFLIRLYQKTLSPDHGWFRFRHPYGFCRYYPSCSEYATRSLKKHGLIKGGLKAVWRLLRCNPWSQGGIDKA
jgi:hypothetical protein